MAYTLIKSNNFETIIAQHAHLFQPASILSPSSYVVTQNNQSAIYLKYRLADQLSICADPRLALPESALRHLILGFPSVRTLLELDHHGLPAKPPLHANEVKLVIYQYLENYLNLQPELAVIKNYVAHKTGADRSALLYQLSKSLASLFISYGMNAPQLMTEWQHHDQPMVDASSSWQQFLWQQLFSIEKQAPYSLLSDLMHYVEQKNEAYDGNEQSIILIGSSFLGESSLSFFKYLSRYITITHFFITPTKTCQTPSDFIRSYTMAAYEFDRYQQMLTSEAQFKLVESYQEYHQSTVLSKIQEKIFNGHSNPIKEHDDQSFKVFATPSLKREIELVKDYILDSLEHDTNLKAQEIAIIAPDINRYAGYIEALFSQEINLPYNIVDLTFTDDLSASFLALLELSSSRFSRSALFNLFSLEPFRKAQKITAEEHDLWLHFCSQGNILWAFDQEHRQMLDLGHSPLYSWQQAFNRFLSSLTIGQKANEACNFDFGSENSWPLVGRLMHIVTELYQGFSHLSTKSQPFDAWEEELERLMRTFLESDEPSSYSLKRVFRNMKEAFETAGAFNFFETKNFSFAVIKNYFKESASIGERRKGEFLRGGVVCSSLKPVRAIPFKVVIILGLDGEHFPTADRPKHSYDLLNSRQEIPLFSLSQRDADRYAFIESIMASRQKLALFYQARHQSSGATLEPSTALEELLSFINPDRFSDTNSLLQSSPWLSPCYPIHSFDQRLFSTADDRYLPSYNPYAFSLARSYYGYQAKNSFDLLTSQPISHQQSGPITIDINQLISFFTDPSRYLFNQQLKCSAYQATLIEDVENESDGVAFKLKLELTKTIEKQLIEGNLADISQLIDQKMAIWYQKGDINQSLLSDHLNAKSYQEIVNFYTMASLAKEQLKDFEAVSYQINNHTNQQLPIAPFTLYTQPYQLVGTLDHLFKKDDKLIHIITLPGTNQLKMAIPALFYHLALSAAPHEHRQLTNYGLNFKQLYRNQVAIEQSSDDAYHLLEFAIKTFVDYQAKPLPFFLSELNKNEMQSKKLLNGWHQAYLSLYKKKEHDLIETLLYPKGIEPLPAAMDEIFDLIYKPLLNL